MQQFETAGTKNAVQQTPPFVSREERAKRWGIECVDALTWRNWNPGGEYVKKLVIKNVSTKAMVVRYKLPTSTNFYMEFPEPIKLSPGMSHPFEVRFRPVDAVNYSDAIEVRTKRGAFLISVRAYLPQICLAVPSNMDFGFCPVKEQTDISFQIQNIGELPVSFEWLVKAPFAIVPSSGTLTPGEHLILKAQFRPEDASVILASAVCRVSNGETATLKMSGIGKYVYLSLSSTDIDFGRVLVEKSATEEVILRNQSLVDACFTIKQMDAGAEGSVCSFTPSSGVIPPESSIPLKVQYVPKIAGTCTSDHFEISSAGGNSIRCSCRGLAIGPHVELSVKSINFGDIREGESCTKLIQLINHSDIPADFHFQTETASAFEIDRITGTLAPMKATTLSVKFSPRSPINYYKRVYLSVKNQHSLYIDLLGSGFNSKKRPASFTQRHVELYRKRAELGLAKISPDRIAELLELNEKEPSNSELRTEAVQRQIDSLLSSLYKDANEPGPSSEEIMEELFVDMTNNRAAPVSIDQSFINFGAVSRLRMAEYKSVYIRNHSDAKMTVQWFVPQSSNSNGSDSPLFTVFPESIDIKAHSTEAFKIHFRPSMDNQYYCAELECFAYFKAMRSFRLVTDQTFTPPTCLTVRVAGNTFSSDSEPFIPRFTFLPNKSIAFSPTHINDIEYQTIELKNTSDCPLLFEWDLSNCYPTVQAKPLQGKVAPLSFQLITFRFHPTEAKRYDFVARCMMNASSAHIVELPVVGIGFVPKIQFENEGTLFFKPTHIGTTSTKELTITNPSRIPTSYTWEIPKKMKRIFSIERTSGILQGNESASIRWIFTPKNQEKYVSVIKCQITAVKSHERAPVSKIQRITSGTTYETMNLTLIGEGSTGAIDMQPSTLLDFGTVLVGASHKRTLTLYNSSDCAVPYVFVFMLENVVFGDRGDVTNGSDPLSPREYVQQLNKSNEDDNSSSSNRFVVVNRSDLTDGEVDVFLSALQIDGDVSGVLPARTHQPITLTFAPFRRVLIHYTVYCVLPLMLDTAKHSTKRTSSAPSRTRRDSDVSPLQRRLHLPLSGLSQATEGQGESRNATGALLPPSSYLEEGDGIESGLLSRIDWKSLTPSDLEEFPHCEVVGYGEFPLMKISDIRCEAISKHRLWTQFSVDEVNLELQKDCSFDQYIVKALRENLSRLSLTKTKRQNTRKLTEDDQQLMDNLLSNSHSVANRTINKLRRSFSQNKILAQHLSELTALKDPLRSARRPNFNDSSSNSVANLNGSVTELSLEAPSTADGSRRPLSTLRSSASWKAAMFGMRSLVMDFGAKPAGSSTTHVLLNLENIGKLPLKFAFRFANEKMLDLERWADDEGLNTEEDEIQQQILDNHIFQISPKEGEIASGESCYVRMSYQHNVNAIDTHTLALLLLLDNGKRLLLDLKGQTLSPRARHLYFPSDQHYLKDVSIGERYPPIQYVELRNVSKQEVSFDIDTSPLQQLQEMNYGFEVIRCPTVRGTIAPMSTFYLPFVFQPIETKQYDVSLPIQIINPRLLASSGGRSLVASGAFNTGDVVLHLSGRGALMPPQEKLVTDDKASQSHESDASSQQSQLSVSFDDDTIPDQQKLLLPGQLARLSIEVLKFGRVPTLSLHRRLVVVHNISATDTISFQWLLSGIPFPEQFVVEPAKGMLAPNSMEVCKITFHVGTHSQLLDLDIICKVINETAKQMREHKQKMYERELEDSHSNDDQVNGLEPPRSTLPSIDRSSQQQGINVRPIRTATSAGSSTFRSIASATTAAAPPLEQNALYSTKHRSVVLRGTASQPLLQPNSMATTMKASVAESNANEATNAPMNSIELFVRIQAEVVFLEDFIQQKPTDLQSTIFTPHVLEFKDSLDRRQPCFQSGSRDDASTQKPTTGSGDRNGSRGSSRGRTLVSLSPPPSEVDHTVHPAELAEEIVCDMLRSIIRTDEEITQAYHDIDSARVPFYHEFAKLPYESITAAIQEQQLDEEKLPSERALLQSNEFMVLTEWILDETVFNILSEAVFGETTL